MNWVRRGFRSFVKKLWVEEDKNERFRKTTRATVIGNAKKVKKGDSDQTVWIIGDSLFELSDSPRGHSREIFAIGCNRYIFFHVILICYRDSLVSPVICYLIPLPRAVRTLARLHAITIINNWTCYYYCVESATTRHSDAMMRRPWCYNNFSS